MRMYIMSSVYSSDARLHIIIRVWKYLVDVRHYLIMQLYALDLEPVEPNSTYGIISRVLNPESVIYIKYIVLIY